MKKLKYTLLLLALVLSIGAHADLLTDILDGKYNARQLSVEQTDSILGNTSTGRYRLEYENEQQLFRRSFLADYYIVDTQKDTRKHLSDTLVRDAVLSPDGRYIAFAKGNNLYLHKLDFGTEVAVTHDENPEIINGIADWLYEEEFGVTCLFAFSPDSKQLAFVRLDETRVPTFTWQEFLGTAYPREASLRYPKAGEPNAQVSVCVYDIRNKTIRTMQTHDPDEDVYLPRLRWTTPVMQGKTELPSELAVLRLNRDQTRMDVLLCNSRSTVSRPLYKEESRDCFIDYELFDQWQWLSDNRFIALSEKSGWRAAYLYSAQGIQQKQLTPDGTDLTAVYGFDESTQTLYYQAATTPQTRQGYMLSLKKGTPVLLTDGEGTHNLFFSGNYRQMIDNYRSVSQPDTYTLYTLSKDGSKRKVKVLEDNADVAKDWAALGIPEKTFFSFTTERGDLLNGWTILPKDFDKTKKYPVLMIQYSGPQSQRVLDQWRKRWEYYLAHEGYIVACVDGRGTGARGADFEKCTYLNLGDLESKDQVETALYLGSLPYVDKDRIAIWGWSFGGFNTLMSMSEGRPVFRAGVAVAAPTNWKYYDTVYTERYMRTPQENASGYAVNPIQRAANLSGDLLLVHGTADDNVHFRNFAEVEEAYVQAGKLFREQVYTNRNHFIQGGNSRLHLFTTIASFFEEKLK